MKKSLLVILITILIINTQTTMASETWYLYESFDFNDPITNWGWEIFNSADMFGIAQTSEKARAQGSHGLQIKSTPDGVFSAYYLLDMSFYVRMSINFLIFNVKNSATVRVTVSDVFGNYLSLDYGPSISGWDAINTIYNVGVEFIEGQWINIHRDLQDDVNTGLDDSDSPFYQFKIKYLLDIDIFQRGDGDIEHEIYLDELKLIIPAGLNLGPTTTRTVYTGGDGPSALSFKTGISILGWLLFFISLISIHIKKFKRFKIMKSKSLESSYEDPYESKIQMDPICTFCGQINQISNEYCGFCGSKI